MLCRIEGSIRRFISIRGKTMKIANRLVFIVFFASITVFTVEYAIADSGQKYVIGNGDVIEISVWTHPELSKEVAVRTDGWISLPLIGEVQVSGADPEILSKRVRAKLIAYIKDPKVSVSVNQIKSKKILVLGEVKKPGVYLYESGLRVFDALGLAAGYNKYAQLKSVMIIRSPYSQHPKFYLANLHKVIHDATLSENVLLEPGDFVFVPQNFIGNVGDFLDFFFARIKPAADSYFIYELARETGKD